MVKYKNIKHSNFSRSNPQKKKNKTKQLQPSALPVPEGFSFPSKQPLHCTFVRPHFLYPFSSSSSTCRLAYPNRPWMLKRGKDSMGTVFASTLNYISNKKNKNSGDQVAYKTEFIQKSTSTTPLPTSRNQLRD